MYKNKRMKIKNLIIKNIKGFNKNKLIALFLSGFVIICIRYHINSLGYASYFSLLFIFFCTLFKSIILVIVESLGKINLITKHNNVLFIDKKFFYENKFKNCT